MATFRSQPMLSVLKRFTLTVAALTALPARPDALSLGDALSSARQNSPEVQRSASAKDEAHWRHVGQYSAYLPTVNATANRLLDKKYMFTDIEFGGNPVSIPNIIPTTTYGLNAEINLFDGFASTNRFRAGEKMEHAANREFDWTMFKTDRDVTLQFYRALAARTLQTVAENNLKTLKDHLHDVNLFRSSGLSTNFDVLRVEVQVSEAESELLNANDNAELAKTKLAETLGVDSAVEPNGALPELAPDLITAADAKDPTKSRPDLEALGERVQGLALQAHAENRHWVPKVSAFGSYTYYNNRNDDFDQWNDFRNAYQVGLSLTWNLFDGFKSTAQSHVAVEQQFQAEKTLRAQQLKAKQDLSFWTRKYKYFISVFHARQNDIGKAKESVRLAREGRKVGARTNTDLLDAESELYRAEAGAITAQMGAIEALINVELSLGQPLYKFN